MITPIQANVKMNGEPAWIITPEGDEPYDPTKLTNYESEDAEDAPGTPVRGITDQKALAEGMGSNLVAAFTTDLLIRPEGLQPKKSILLWRQVNYTIDQVRDRFYLGKPSGLTFLLTK